MALHSLISSQYPRDYLGIVGFGRGGPRAQAPSSCPRCAGTSSTARTCSTRCCSPARMLARQTGTKQIIMVTDGEPTAHIERRRGVSSSTRRRASHDRGDPARGAALHPRRHPHQHVHARREPRTCGSSSSAERAEPGPGVLHDARHPRRLRARRLHRAAPPAAPRQLNPGGPVAGPGHSRRWYAASVGSSKQTKRTCSTPLGVARTVATATASAASSG